MYWLSDGNDAGDMGWEQADGEVDLWGRGRNKESPDF